MYYILEFQLTIKKPASLPKGLHNLKDKNRLGRGASGDVYRIGKVRAVKVIEADERSRTSALKEFNVLAKL